MPLLHERVDRADENELNKEDAEDKQRFRKLRGAQRLRRRRPRRRRQDGEEEEEEVEDEEGDGEDDEVGDEVEEEEDEDEEEEDKGEDGSVRRPRRPGHRRDRRGDKKCHPGRQGDDEDIPEEEEEEGKVVHVKDGESIQPAGELLRRFVQVESGELYSAALDTARPGTTIVIGTGVYHEALKSRVDGTKEEPITLRGNRRGEPAIVKGEDGRAACIEINHDYYILEHFRIDGTIKDNCGEDEVKDAYREKCLAIRGTRSCRDMEMENGDTYRSAVQGVVVRHMRISNSGGEGILLRYFVTGCRIHHCKIISTGCYDFKFQKADRGIKNGEGVYLGTSSNQWHKNLTDEEDVCCFNKIFNNYIDTHGNECVDVKEGSLHNIIESNYCTGQLDEDSGGIDSRADRTVIRYNKVVGCKGAGVRLGGHKVGDVQYGIHCKVYGNILNDNEFCGVKIMTSPHQICQNTISGQGDDYKLLRGKCSSEFEEGAECPFVVEEKEDVETKAWFQRLRDL